MEGIKQKQKDKNLELIAKKTAKNGKNKNQKKQRKISWMILNITLTIYLIIFLLNKQIFLKSTFLFFTTLYNLIPTLIIIFILMAITNYFFKKELIEKLNEKGIKKWIFTIISGIISTGPIYLWYPLLKELKERGISLGLIACFLYNRAIKLALIPLAIHYFGVIYVIILTALMILFSILNGIIIDRIIPKTSMQNNEK